MTETSNDQIDLSAVDIFYSITTEQIKVVLEGEIDGQSFCETEVEAITNIDGNMVTTEDGDGSTSTATVEVSDGGNTLTAKGIDGETVTATRVDGIPDCGN